MSSTAIVLNADNGQPLVVQQPLPAAVIRARRESIVQLMRDVMVSGVDYGTIKGTPKPTLYKPGSEKLLSMFGFACKPVINDLSTPDTIRYQVHCVISEIGSGRIVGEGIGEASSAESKYQWREVVCKEEWEQTPVDRRREKWKKGGAPNYVAYMVQQVRAEMEDVANTILKMAKKRSQIDAVLTVTAASDVFSQDLEDLKAAGINPDILSEDETNTLNGEPKQPSDQLQKKNSETVQQPQTPQQSQPAAQPTQQQKPPLTPSYDQRPPQQQRPANTQSGRTISDAQGRRFYGIARNAGWQNEDINEYLRSEFGVSRSEHIPAAEYEKVIKWAEGGGR